MFTFSSGTSFELVSILDIIDKETAKAIAFLNFFWSVHCNENRHG